MTEIMPVPKNAYYCLTSTGLRVVFFCVRLGVHRRVSRLTVAVAADSRDTSSKAPRFIRRRRRFGAFLVARSKKKHHPTGWCFLWKCAAASVKGNA